MINKKKIYLHIFFIIFFPLFSCTKQKDYTGMSWIKPGEFMMGGMNHSEARNDEFPSHKVKLNGFWIDQTEITNSEFMDFVNETNYVTTAEIVPTWEEIKDQLPPGTQKPDDSLFVASSLVFKPSPYKVPLSDVSTWWEWRKGANWKHPFGEGSSIKEIMNHPVVHISYFDAVEYCKWRDKRLPTEAEWEYAAKGGEDNVNVTWGNGSISSSFLNSWEGDFPFSNTKKDGYYYTAPVKTYTPNGYELFDMAGNVWEWCNDWYDYNYYKLNKSLSINPKGPNQSFDPQEPYSKKRVLRGGSFLCNSSYCSGYRVTARMKSSPDSGMSHTGFRCACN